MRGPNGKQHKAREVVVHFRVSQSEAEQGEELRDRLGLSKSELALLAFQELLEQHMLPRDRYESLTGSGSLEGYVYGKPGKLHITLSGSLTSRYGKSPSGEQKFRKIIEKNFLRLRDDLVANVPIEPRNASRKSSTAV